MINHTINMILQQRHSHSKIDTRLSLDTLYMHKNHSFIYLPDVTERCLKKNNSKLKKKTKQKGEIVQLRERNYVQHDFSSN